eukprot:GHVU01026405.1.p1 GENE.GHVU01026405.1~~GHVU01026405.1.p1  ORF type:complete len:115 (+),score=13.22 GHVU01026405.1:457-801(+)
MQPAAPDGPRDELKEYLDEPTPQGSVLGLMGNEVLDYWYQRKGSSRKMDKMVKEVFACPASTAGNERRFSGIGRSRERLQHMMKESTLQRHAHVAVNWDLVSLCEKMFPAESFH